MRECKPHLCSAHHVASALASRPSPRSGEAASLSFSYSTGCTRMATRWSAFLLVTACSVVLKIDQDLSHLTQPTLFLPLSPSPTPFPYYLLVPFLFFSSPLISLSLFLFQFAFASLSFNPRRCICFLAYVHLVSYEDRTNFTRSRNTIQRGFSFRFLIESRSQLREIVT